MTDPEADQVISSRLRARLVVNPPVFFVSAGLIIAFALLGAIFPERAGRLFSAVQATIVTDFGWLYIAAVAGFLVFVIFLLFSRYGDVKLGPTIASQSIAIFPGSRCCSALEWGSA